MSITTNSSNVTIVELKYAINPSDLNPPQFSTFSPQRQLRISNTAFANNRVLLSALVRVVVVIKSVSLPHSKGEECSLASCDKNHLASLFDEAKKVPVIYESQYQGDKTALVTLPDGVAGALLSLATDHVLAHDDERVYIAAESSHLGDMKNRAVSFLHVELLSESGSECRTRSSEQRHDFSGNEGYTSDGERGMNGEKDSATENAVVCCPVECCPVNRRQPLYDRSTDRIRGLEPVIVGDQGLRCIVTDCHCNKPGGLPVNAVAMWCCVCDSHICLDCIVKLQNTILLKGLDSSLIGTSTGSVSGNKVDVEAPRGEAADPGAKSSEVKAPPEGNQH